jgi:formylglycine-generating enzyme required for sulfatase activity/serine/threonine protein kinase
MNPPPDDDERTILAPAPAFPNALAAGTKLGEFEITRVIGQGGFGIVYLARDHSLGRDVALKEYMPTAFAGRSGETQVTILSEHYAETFNVGLSSFVKEAQLLARFDHPCLVKVYRFWQANGTGYMAMPYYQAPTLKQMLKEEHSLLATEAWLKVFLGHILNGLNVLHDKQCYHRDIAPDNILMLDRAIPLLLDFGAARRVIGDMTQALTVILKPGYAPIEQYGEMGDMSQGPWTDLYALASVIYFIIAGKVPQAALSRLVDDKLVPLAESAKDRYSPGFLQAIDAALSVRPEHRPQSAAALRAMLQLEDTPVTHEHRSSTVLVEADRIPATRSGPAAPATAAARTAAAKAAPETAGTQSKPVGLLGGLPVLALAGAAVALAAISAVLLWPGKTVLPAAPQLIAAKAAAPQATPARPPCALHRADGKPICPVMVKIPAGSYRVGSQPGERDAAPEELGATAQPIGAFEMSAYEVTAEQWQLCVDDGGCTAPTDSSGTTATMPVTNVSWDAVQSYIGWLSKKTGTAYRLPSEAEWEYAARAGRITLFPWGDRIGEQNAHCGQCGTLGEYPHAAPVGSFKPYGGLYDMVGNVYEWVDDCWTPSHGAQPAAAAQPNKASCKKVQKGGAFDSMGADVRPMARTSGDRTKGDPRVGFRLAK